MATVTYVVENTRTAAYLLKAKLFRFRYGEIDYRVLEVGGPAPH